jgi:hypothetical protein
MTTAVNIDRDLPLSGLTPTPDERPLFNNIVVTPTAGVAYRYSLVLPSGWYKLPDMPGEKAFPEVGRFTALGVFSPYEQPAPPVLLSAGVTLPPSRDSVASHFERYCHEEGFEIIAMRPSAFCVGNVVDGLALQNAPPIGEVKMRIAMFEDGGRLFVLSGMAPSPLYSKFIRFLSLAMLTFELAHPAGPVLPLVSE